MSGTTITLPAPPVCTVDATGIHVPAFQDILAYFVSGYQAIYGADVYLGNDSQDGELISLMATSYNDANTMAVSAYNAFSPVTAQGTGLSSVVKINGISRLIPTNSTVDLTIIGVSGTVLAGAVVSDGTYRWDLPTTIIPGSGLIIATATCETIGAITGTAGTITQILTPTAGWQSVSNLGDAVVGQPVELDSALTQRQAVSTMLPSVTVLDGIVGAISLITGVIAVQPYENDTAAPDSNGIPSHSIAIVVNGGDAVAIAQTIATKKSPGAGTYGTTSEVITDVNGVPHIINFFRPTEVVISVTINIHNLPGYTSTIGGNIVSSVVNYINSLGIGQSVLIGRVYVPANLMGPFAILLSPNDPATFELLSLTMSRVESTTLSGPVSSTTITTINVADDIGFPYLSGPVMGYTVQIDAEQVLVVSGQGTLVWTVVRGYANTVATTHLSGAIVTLVSSTADVVLAFTEMAECAISNVTLNVF
jgi:uncharacterized phage protein gp47/JayE